MERGIVSAGRDIRSGENVEPKLELARLTIPRRVYTESQINSVAKSVIELFEKKDMIKGLKMTYESKHLRFLKQDSHLFNQKS